MSHITRGRPDGISIYESHKSGLQELKTKLQNRREYYRRSKAKAKAEAFDEAIKILKEIFIV